MQKALVNLHEFILGVDQYLLGGGGNWPFVKKSERKWYCQKVSLWN